jgi:hypothetical protein
LNKGWIDGNWNRQPKFHTRFNGLAVLRDPLKRWRGSLGELTWHMVEHGAGQKEVEQWFKDAPFLHKDYYDIHFVSQRAYCAGLDINKVRFFKMPDVMMIPNFLGYSEELRHMNQSLNPVRVEIMERIDDLMTHEVIEMLMERYAEDFELMELISENNMWY